MVAKTKAQSVADRLKALAHRIAWTSSGPLLARGVFGGVPADIMREIAALAGEHEIAARAATLTLHPRMLVLALAALHVAKGNRHAARVLRAILDGRPECALTLAAAEHASP